MGSEPLYDLGGTRLPYKAKVILKLKPNNYDTNRLKYQVKDQQTIVVEGIKDCKKHGAGKMNRDISLFTFDEIFDVKTGIESITNALSGDTINDLLNGYSVSIMAYGQSNTGKSALMFGNGLNDGIIPTLFKELFENIKQTTEKGSEFTIGASFIAVKAENIYDLLGDPKNGKSLKLSTNSRPDKQIVVKDLRTVYVVTLDELLYYMTIAKNNLHVKERNSRSNTIIKIFVEQRDESENTVKRSILQLIDLAGSDKLDKMHTPALSQDEVRRINLSMYSLDNVARSLAAKQNALDGASTAIHDHKHVPHKESHLTRLLQGAMGGNSKISVLLTCSAAEHDHEETLNTLDFGANMTMVNNLVEQNISGLNSKVVQDLLLKNMSIKESNYISRIKLLENELKEAQTKVRRELHEESGQKEEILMENKKLKVQLDSLSQLLKKPDMSKHSGNNQEEQSDIVSTIIEKCEKIIELQMKLDREIAKNHSTTQELSYKNSKEEALEAMNMRLLEQLQANEEELKFMLISNSVMKDSMEKWSNVAATRLESIKVLENALKEFPLSRQDIRSKRRSSGSSSGSTMVHIEEDPNTEKGSWFFGNSNSTLWGTRKVSSGSSVITPASQESTTARAPKIGLNLRVVRPTEEEKNEV